MSTMTEEDEEDEEEEEEEEETNRGVGEQGDKNGEPKTTDDKKDNESSQRTDQSQGIVSFNPSFSHTKLYC